MTEAEIASMREMMKQMRTEILCSKDHKSQAINVFDETREMMKQYCIPEMHISTRKDGLVPPNEYYCLDYPHDEMTPQLNHYFNNTYSRIVYGRLNIIKNNKLISIINSSSSCDFISKFANENIADSSSYEYDLFYDYIISNIITNKTPIDVYNKMILIINTIKKIDNDIAQNINDMLLMIENASDDDNKYAILETYGFVKDYKIVIPTKEELTILFNAECAKREENV